MSENHARLRAFKFYYDNGTAVASDELRDAMDLLRDYDGLAARLAEAEALLRDIAGFDAAISFFAPELGGVRAAIGRIDAFLTPAPK